MKHLSILLSVLLSLTYIYTQSPSIIPPKVIPIKGGQYFIGSHQSDQEAYWDEYPRTAVTVPDFEMGIYEITIAQFRQFVQATNYITDAEQKAGGWYYDPNENWRYRQDSSINWRHDGQGNLYTQDQGQYPVGNISWHDATAYCKWLSQATGDTYRLPTEAEWQYAASEGGKDIRFAWGNQAPQGKQGGNVADLSGKKIVTKWKIFPDYNDQFPFASPVGSFAPNALGLYDLSGNVWEHCQTAYVHYRDGTDIFNPKLKIRRGGSWADEPEDLRINDRRYNWPNHFDPRVGFRIVREK